MTKESAKVPSDGHVKLSVRTTVGEAIALHPKVAAVFERYGMRCTTCTGANAEPIAKACELYGLDPHDLLRELSVLLSGG
jgi:hybrid cluster-associated redox disulfide protein